MSGPRGAGNRNKARPAKLKGEPPPKVQAKPKAQAKPKPVAKPKADASPKPVAKPKAVAKSGTRIVDAKFLAGAAPGGNLPPPVNVELAFAGRSNVGKSSLINTLLERKNLVRTSSTPGSTRQLNLYEAKAADGTLFHLVDLPGYGFTHRSKREQGAWKELIEGYLSMRGTLAGVVLLVDVRRGLEDDDRELVDFIQSVDHPSRRPLGLVVGATKLDKLPRASRRPALEALRKTVGSPETPSSRLRLVGFSSETGEGREELWSTLRTIALGSLPASAEAELEAEVDPEPESAPEPEVEG